MGQHGWQLATSSDAHEICIHGGVHSLYDFPCELLTLIAHVFFPFCTPAKKNMNRLNRSLIPSMPQCPSFQWFSLSKCPLALFLFSFKRFPEVHCCRRAQEHPKNISFSSSRIDLRGHMNPWAPFIWSVPNGFDRTGSDPFRSQPEIGPSKPKRW